MKQALRYFLSLLLSAIMVVSTSGVMVHLHHCYHKQTTYTSWFIDFSEGESHPCAVESAPVSCCTPEDYDGAVQCSSGCCEDILLLLKYDPDTEPAHRQIQKIAPIAQQLPADAATALSVWDSSIFTQHDLPPPEKPPLWGRQLVIFHCQLKADPFC
jgi:hypothetical protein